jgi:hypothetical protein
MTSPHLQAPGGIDLSRRSLLKLGVAGGMVLGVAGLTAELSGCGGKRQASASGFRFLRDADLALFSALIPVVLDGILPEDETLRSPQVAETLQRIDAACYPLNPSAQAELYKLFDLLNLRATRWLATGVSAPWPEAGRRDIEHFLLRWRDSRIGLFNAGYRALTKLVSTAYFGTSASWPAAGYPGPLDWVYKAVNS